MIATQILIFMVVISSALFITCPTAANASATKPIMNKYSVVNDPAVVNEELAQSNTIIVNNSVPTQIRRAVTKSFGLLLWPVTKPWKIVKSFIPKIPNVTGTYTENNGNDISI